MSKGLCQLNTALWMNAVRRLVGLFSTAPLDSEASWAQGVE